MELQNLSLDQRKKILIEFTRAVLQNSLNDQMFELEQIIKKENEKKRPNQKFIIPQKKIINPVMNKTGMQRSILEQTPNTQKRTLITASNNISPEISVLQKLFKKPEVHTITCKGEGIPLEIDGNTSTETLTKEEIKKIFEKFEIAPDAEGIIRKKVNEFSILAVQSKITEPIFTITKN